MVRELPTFELDVNGTGQTEVIDPNLDLLIQESNLMAEFSEQPSKFAFYGGLHSDSLITLKKLTNILKSFEADKEIEARQRIAARYGPKERITKDLMAAEFARDPDWQKANEIVLDWEKTVNRLEVMKDAFKQRAQMLWQIGATRRQEMVRLHNTDTTEE
jgi:hypothetical protein